MRSPKLIVGLFILLFGLFALMNVLNNSRVKTLQGSDIVQLIAVGLCFGAGVVLLIEKLLGQGG
jgi:hypothetical protein